MVGIGSHAGGYELLAKLGSGGMASLYLARRGGGERAGTDRLAAVKVVHPHLSENETFVLMFEDEARLSALIRHPNVVRVDHFGDEQGTHFMAMEYVHGCSLAQLLSRLAATQLRPRPELAVHIAMKVLAGLHAAHDAKDEAGRPLEIVHRDVSPQNILLSFGGQVKLIDFGIAKARFRLQETKSLSIKGKVAYMAPEQVTMLTPVDRRSDVYALGIVLYEMLTMRRYFDGENDLALLDVVRAPPRKSPRDHVAIPEALDRVILSALAPDPADRPASAHAFQRALEAALPDARAIDSNELAELLGVLMKDVRKKLDDKLPSAVRDGLGVPIAANERVHTMTLEVSIEGPAAVWNADTFDQSAEDDPRVDEADAHLRADATPMAIEAPAARPLSRALRLGALALLIVVAAIAGGVAALVAGSRPQDDVSAPPPASAPTVLRAPEPEPEVIPPSIEHALSAGGPSDPSATTAAAPAPTVGVGARAEACAREGDHACVVELLGERATDARELAMLVDAKDALGEDDEVRRLAALYLERYPDGPAAARLAPLAAPPASRASRPHRRGASRRRGSSVERPQSEVGALPFADDI